MLLEVFSKDTLKSLFSAYNEFTKAQGAEKKVVSGREAARMLGEKARRHSKIFFQNARKEG